MITRRGAQKWANVHLTEKTDLVDLIDIDNSTHSERAGQPGGFAVLREAAQELDSLIQDARRQGQQIRALGAGWALTDIAVTRGWLINTKPLNGCFDVSDEYFESTYGEAKRPYLVIAQCGMSVGELNVYLEVARQSTVRRAMKTSGIGAGQTIAGAVSGNTHGGAITFGSTPDFVVGLQLVTGSGTSLWIERASSPVLNDEFIASLGAVRIRDDDVFNAAVVSFGSFGVISAVAVETDPIYQLVFPGLRDIDHQSLRKRLEALAHADVNDPSAPYHYELIFDPYDTKQLVLEVSATKVDYEPGHEPPAPVWIVRNKRGFTLGDRVSRVFLDSWLLSARRKTAIQYRQYRDRCVLHDVRGTPGQVFTATITYFEGYAELAVGVSIDDAVTMVETSTSVIKQLNLPWMSQVRVVHPSQALLGFTRHLPKTAVFEFGLSNDARFPVFQKTLSQALAKRNVKHTFHWSKNAGIDHQTLLDMYGADRVARWRAARARVFDDDPTRMKVFNNPHLERAGLA